MSNITLYEFNGLPEQEKHQMLHSRGTFLDVIEGVELKFVLYGLEKFYVELTYNSSSNSIVSLSTFKQGEKLDKFLDRFQI